MVVVEKNVVYGSVLGAGLVADVAYPEGDKGPFPILLSVHGGRWIRGTRHDNGAIDVEKWAELGYFAMTIDYRLVTCSPAPACYEDVLCAIRWVHAHAEEYSLDSKGRFYLVGQSAGGHMVSLAATLGLGNFAKRGGWENESHDFTAAISVSGAYDLVKLDWGSGWIPPGEPWDRARAYASPINHISPHDTKPILILHSMDDHSIPVEQAKQMHRALLETLHDAPYPAKIFADQGHMLITDTVIDQILSFIASIEGKEPTHRTV